MPCLTSLCQLLVAFLIQEPKAQAISSAWSPYIENMPAHTRPADLQDRDLQQIFQSTEALLAHTRPRKVETFLQNWSSGGRLQTPRAFTNEAWNTWMARTFQDLTQTFPEIRLDLLDLFHGHLVWNEEREEALIVLHSKEYPNDLDPFHVTRALEFEPELESFRSTDQSFRRRNLIWSLKHNMMWRLDTGEHSPFYPLIDGEPGSLEKQANTLPETLFGRPVADINVFVRDQHVLMWFY